MNRYQRQQAEYGAKKHYTQMTELEKDFLVRQFRAVNKLDWKFTPYSWGKVGARGIDIEHLLTIFDLDSEIIEYHRKDGENRVLVRGKRSFNGANVCVVFAPEVKKIVTIYLNNENNKHDKLRIEFYDSNIDILKLYKKGGNRS